uniref:Uncharacterized protein n=1 Tax=Arundo donax TaxID=35708 RepID=A0A0A9GCE3_ARUDO
MPRIMSSKWPSGRSKAPIPKTKSASRRILRN